MAKSSQLLRESDKLPNLIGELALYPQDKWLEHTIGKSEDIHGHNLILREIYKEIDELRWLKDTTTYLFCRTERIREIQRVRGGSLTEFAYIPIPGLKNGRRIKHPCEFEGKGGLDRVLTEAPMERSRELAWLIPYKTSTGEKTLAFIFTFDPLTEIKVRTITQEWDKCTKYWKSAVENQGLIRVGETVSCLHAFTGLHEWMNILETKDGERTPQSWKRHFINASEASHGANRGLDIYYSNSIVAYAWSTLEKQRGRERARMLLQQDLCKRVVLFDPIYGRSQGVKSDKKLEAYNFLLPGDTEREKMAKSFWDNTIGSAHSSGSSDIHIEPMQVVGRPGCDLIVSLRKDGQLNFHTRVPSELAQDFSRFALETSGIIKEELKRPQDGRRGWVNPITREAIDLRISVTPVGAPIQKVVMRLLDTNKLKRGIADIGLEPDEVRLWEKALALNQSLVLVSGPTNSGKSAPGHTRILTDKGLITLKDIVSRHESGENFLTWNENGWEPVTNVHHCGVKEVVEIKTASNTSLTVAGTHPFLVVQKDLSMVWKKTSDLSRGDRLVFHGKEPTSRGGDWQKYWFMGIQVKKAELPAPLWGATPYEIAGFFSGWIDANGNCSSRGIKMLSKKKKKAQGAKTILASLGIRASLKKKALKNKVLWEIQIKDSRSIRSLVNLGLSPTVTNKINTLLKYLKKVQKDPKVKFPVGDYNTLIRELEDAVCQTYGSKPKKTRKKILDLMPKSKKHIKITHLAKIFEVFPKALPLLPKVKRILDGHLEPDVIKSIKRTGKYEEMYDIEVGSAHTYQIQGLICHNSTTLYAALLSIYQRDTRRSFATIEDPVEYRLPFRATQSPVDDSKGASYENLIRQAMRNDGDTFLIGEIRDSPTANASLQLSLTGHQVLSSIHANSAPETALRLLEFGVDPYILSETLKMVVAQRLVPTCCPYCKKQISESEVPALLRKYGGEILLESYGSLWERKYRKKANWIRGEGCPQCQFTGLSGLTAAQEFLVIDHKNRKFLKEGNIEKLEDSMKEKSLLKMEEIVWKFAWQGRIPIEQAGELTNQLKSG